MVEVGAEPPAIDRLRDRERRRRRRRNRDYEIRAGDAPKVTSVAAARSTSDSTPYYR